MTKDDALELTLQWFSKLLWFENDGIVQLGQVKKAIKEALAQDEQEPDDLTIAYMSGFHDGKKKREWVGLTDEEIWGAVDRIGTSDSNVNPYQTIKDARAIEAKLKEKKRLQQNKLFEKSYKRSTISRYR